MPKTDEYEPELVVKDDGQVFYLSDDGEGHMVAWTSCHANSGGCGKPIMSCNCKGGPKEPYYITRWRVEAQGGVWQKPKGNSGVRAPERPLGARKVPTSPSSFSETRSGGMSISDFIDADVIAKVKAASETSEADRQAAEAANEDAEHEAYVLNHEGDDD